MKKLTVIMLVLMLVGFLNAAIRTNYTDDIKNIPKVNNDNVLEVLKDCKEILKKVSEARKQGQTHIGMRSALKGQEDALKEKINSIEEKFEKVIKHKRDAQEIEKAKSILKTIKTHIKKNTMTKTIAKSFQEKIWDSSRSHEAIVVRRKTERGKNNAKLLNAAQKYLKKLRKAERSLEKFTK